VRESQRVGCAMGSGGTTPTTRRLATRPSRHAPSSFTFCYAVRGHSVLDCIVPSQPQDWKQALDLGRWEAQHDALQPTM